jgi:hypothetical protein
MEPAAGEAARAFCTPALSTGPGVARSARTPEEANTNTRPPTAAADVINLEMRAMSDAPLVVPPRDCANLKPVSSSIVRRVRSCPAPA